MMGPSFAIQLLGQSPTLIVYVVAIVLALAWRARSPAASTLVLAGAGLALTMSVAWAGLLVWAMRSGNVQWLQRASLPGNLMHAAALAMFVAAAFVGRGRGQGAGFEIPTAGYAPPPSPPPSSSRS